MQERTSLVYRIVQGKFKIRILGQDFFIHAPNLNILAPSQELYNEIIDEYKYHSWITEDECQRVLIYNGIWSVDKDKKMEQYEKLIETQKIEIYKAFFDFNKRIKLKDGLRYLRDELNLLDETKHSLDYLTLRGFANIIQSQFIISQIVYTLDGQLYFKDFNNANYSVLNIFQAAINSQAISPEEYKDVARNEPWGSFWKSAKIDVFPVKGVQLTSEQRNLILFSQMYDNIYEHPETPHEAIINDDDALDGWMLQQKKDREAKKGEQTVRHTIGGIPDSAQEVFIPASSLDDISRIESLNTLEGKMIKTQRKVAIQQAGQLEDAKLPDNQVLIRQKLLEQNRRGK
jgi:hypothetical protein